MLKAFAMMLMPFVSVTTGIVMLTKGICYGVNAITEKNGVEAFLLNVKAFKQHKQTVELYKFNN
jgi:hypothetical protein